MTFFTSSFLEWEKWFKLLYFHCILTFIFLPHNAKPKFIYTLFTTWVHLKTSYFSYQIGLRWFCGWARRQNVVVNVTLLVQRCLPLQQHCSLLWQRRKMKKIRKWSTKAVDSVCVDIEKETQYLFFFNAWKLACYLPPTAPKSFQTQQEMLWLATLRHHVIENVTIRMQSSKSEHHNKMNSQLVIDSNCSLLTLSGCDRCFARYGTARELIKRSFDTLKF